MLNSTPSIRIRSFLQIAPYLARRGLSPLEFFRRLGVSPNIFQDPDVYLPRALCFHIANEVVATAQDPYCGAHVGYMTELRSLGMWGNLILRSADVAHACEIAAANVAMLHHGSDVRFITEGKTARIIYRFSGQYEMDPRQFIYGSLAVLRKVPLMTGEPAAIRVHLTTSRAKGDDVLEDCLGPSLEMGCEHDMIEFDRDLLHMPLRVQTDQALKVTEALRSTVDAAGLLIKRLPDHQQLELRNVAKRMGMSPRTLQRRLKYCGVDFEELLDETRRSEALRLISEGKHTMTDIAYRIGYSDSAHFTRAFRRWTGGAPSRFRLNSQT